MKKKQGTAFKRFFMFVIFCQSLVLKAEVLSDSLEASAAVSGRSSRRLVASCGLA